MTFDRLVFLVLFFGVCSGGWFGGKTDFTCLKCSSASDRDCVENPDPKTTCNATKEECFTFIYPPTNIVLRGCVGDADTPISGELTKYSSICSSESNCNNQTITIEHCHSTKYSKQDLIDGMPMIEMKTCNVALTPLGCYFQHDSKADSIVTGCVSDLAEEDPKSDMQICIGSECNAKYTFMTCLTHEQHDVMKLHYDDVTINLCDSVDDCFTHIYNGTLIERGCQSVVLPRTSDRCEDIKELCISCDNHIGCNRMGMIFSADESSVLNDSSGSREDDEFESAENEKEWDSEIKGEVSITGEGMPVKDLDELKSYQETEELRTGDEKRTPDEKTIDDEKATSVEKTDVVDKFVDSERTADEDKAKDGEKSGNAKIVEKLEQPEDTKITDNIENSANKDQSAAKGPSNETVNSDSKSDKSETPNKSEESETYNESEESETLNKSQEQKEPEEGQDQEKPKEDDQEILQNDERQEDSRNPEEDEISNKSVEREPDNDTIPVVRAELEESGAKPFYSTGNSGVDTMILVGLGMIVVVPLIAFIVFKYFARNSSRPKQHRNNPPHESFA